MIVTRDETAERERFVQATLSYLGTAYHHHARIKGVGVDCATLLVCAAQEAGLLPEAFELPEYSPMWHLTRSAEKYLHTILKVCTEVEGPPRSGDIVIYKFGRTFSHGAVVVKWPMIIHACIHDRVRTDDASKCAWLTTVGEQGLDLGKPRPMKIVSLWPR